MKDTLLILAQRHYELGLINYDEYQERCLIAIWLDDSEEEVVDPRFDQEDSVETEMKTENDHENKEMKPTLYADNMPDWIKFTFAGTWEFTRYDDDYYPSIPHGHLTSKDKKWPKINPYTGRVFSTKYQESRSLRLSKIDMKKLWSNEKFKSFCREMIVCYQEHQLHSDFSVTRPIRFLKL